MDKQTRVGPETTKLSEGRQFSFTTGKGWGWPLGPALEVITRNLRERGKKFNKEKAEARTVLKTKHPNQKSRTLPKHLEQDGMETVDVVGAGSGVVLLQLGRRLCRLKFVKQAAVQRPGLVEPKRLREASKYLNQTK